jgi:hypothetical protein
MARPLTGLAPRHAGAARAPLHMAAPTMDDGPSVLRATRPLPPLGGVLFIGLPSSIAGPGAAQLYGVTDSDHEATVTARAVVGLPPTARGEAPYVVRYGSGTDEVTVDALAASEHDGSLVVRLNTEDARRDPRYRSPVPLSVEVPGADGAAVLGVTRDVSVGGVRALLPQSLAPIRRVFLSLHFSKSAPIIAVARMLSCESCADEPGWLARFEFTLMAAHDRERLSELLEGRSTA